MLELKNVSSFYENIQALFDVSFQVNEGEIVTIIGANGAGKSTILKTVMHRVKTVQGEVFYQDKDITNMRTEDIVSGGLVLVPEGRRIFPGLTVLENLEMGAIAWKKGGESYKDDLENVVELFPRLKERYKQPSWSLSGGEAQMLAIGRGLMARPKLLMLDEPSLGLSPILIEQVFTALTDINKQGITILLVEQNANMALNIAKRGLVLVNGKIKFEAKASEKELIEQLKEAYLGNKSERNETLQNAF